MVDPTRTRLQKLYRALADKPLWPNDPAYVDLYANNAISAKDPVERMATCIEFAELETVQLFSGHRGTGKSTQLRALKRRLERSPVYKVVICDMEDYLPMTDTIEVVDFLLAAAGALSEALTDPNLLGADPSHQSYWTRFAHWVSSTNIEAKELGIGAKAAVGKADEGLGAELQAEVKLNLKTDPSFRESLRKHMKLHVGAFRKDVHAFMQGCLTALRKRHGKYTQLVVIYDSIEHLRGLTTNAGDVSDSVERLFRGHADALRVPHLHMVLTVPPWLRLQYPVAADRFDGYYQVPCIKVRKRGPGSLEAAPEPELQGLETLRTLALRREESDWLDWLLGGSDAFNELALASGGYLRDLFRMLRDLLVGANASGVPVSEEQRGLAIQELRAGYRGFSNQEAAWLRGVEQTGTLDFDLVEQHHRIAVFLDTHILLAYLNGEDWYGVHPVIRENVARRARAWDAAQEKARRDEPRADEGE